MSLWSLQTLGFEAVWSCVVDLWCCRLTLEQKELCRSRLKLLCYLDRLATYEVRLDH